MSIEQTIADAVQAVVQQAVKPLQAEVSELRKAIEAQTAPHDEWVRQNELPKYLGSVGLTRVRALCRQPNAPKPNMLGLYSVKEWRDFVKNTAIAA